jgi:hypothetical protein
LHPVQVGPGVDIFSVAAAIGLEQRLAEKHADQEVIGGANRSKRPENRAKNQPRRGNAETPNRLVERARGGGDPLI